MKIISYTDLNEENYVLWYEAKRKILMRKLMQRDLTEESKAIIQHKIDSLGNRTPIRK